MLNSQHNKLVAACLLSATCCFPNIASAQDAAAAAIPSAAAPSTPTLWSFLGIPQGYKKVKGALTNRRGNTPRLEPKNALKALNDPANLESMNPAIKRAAEIKVQEDLKLQKMKAIKYLTSIGCGCYDLDGSVTDALIATSQDCTEEVRLATMQAIHKAATGKCCNNCGQVCCCNEKMMKKLAEVAYERDGHGCYKEPSARVRQAAAAALKACCPGSVPLEILASLPEIIDEPPAPEPDADKKPEPEPEPEPDVKPDPESDPAPMPDGAGSFELNGSDDGPEEISGDAVGVLPAVPVRSVSEMTATRKLPPIVHDPSLPTGIRRMRELMISSGPLPSASPNPEGGIVMAFDPNSLTAYVHFDSPSTLIDEGEMVHLRPDPNLGTGFHGSWVVTESAPGCANLQPIGRDGIDLVVVGDHVRLGSVPVSVAPASFYKK